MELLSVSMWVLGMIVLSIFLLCVCYRWTDIDEEDDDLTSIPMGNISPTFFGGT